MSKNKLFWFKNWFKNWFISLKSGEKLTKMYKALRITGKYHFKHWFAWLIWFKSSIAYTMIISIIETSPTKYPSFFRNCFSKRKSNYIKVIEKTWISGLLLNRYSENIVVFIYNKYIKLSSFYTRYIALIFIYKIIKALNNLYTSYYKGLQRFLSNGLTTLLAKNTLFYRGFILIESKRNLYGN